MEKDRGSCDLHLRMGVEMKFLVYLTTVAFLFMALGIVSNVTTMATNHGHMPVFAPDCADFLGVILDPRHICGSAETHLNILSDWILIGTAQRSFWVSPGDVFLLCGYFIAWIGITGILGLVFIRLLRIWYVNIKRSS